MRLLLISIYLILNCSNFYYTQKGKIVDIKNLEQNPGNLKGSIYVPNKLESFSRKRPLVVLLHGCNQTSQNFLEISGFQKYADSLGFYILLPEQKMVNNPNKCFNWFYEKDISHQTEGEAKSILSMINYTEGTFPIDIYSVHVVGISAGAAMANALMYHYPNTIKSGAVIAGGPVGLANNPIEAMKVLAGNVHYSQDEYASRCKHCKGINRFPKVMLVHGNNDIVVKYANMSEATKQWLGIMGNDIYDSISNNKYLQNDRLTVTVYTDSAGHELIKTVTIKNFGHKYPQERGDCYGEAGSDGLFAEDISYNLTLDLVHFFDLSPQRLRPNKKQEPSWEHKYVSLSRFCDGFPYELETSTDTCSSDRFVNYTLSEINGCEVSDYYFIRSQNLENLRK